MKIAAPRSPVVPVATILVWLLVAIHCRAQVAWTRDPSILPATAGGLMLAYDSGRDRMVALGAGNLGNFTWEHDGITWNPVSSPVMPAGRQVGMMAYDPRRSRVVLFGANGPTGNSGDTWEWDGFNWMLVAATGPSPRLTAAGVYHPGRQRLMLFGGDGLDPLGNTIGFNDLWEWDGSIWTLVGQPSGVAPPLFNMAAVYRVSYHTLTYDWRRQRLVVYGGYWFTNGGSGGAVDWIWEWDAAVGWVEQTTVSRPLLFTNKLMYDQQRDRLVVTGFPPSGGGAKVYEWDGSSPAWRLRNTLAQTPYWTDEYDSLRGRVMRVNTDGSAWVYAPIQPAAVLTHGNGCAGALGTPGIRPTAPWTLPWLGDTVSLDITNLPLGAAVMLMGFSDQHSGSTTLPFDLGSYGMPSCFLRVANDASRLVLGSGHTAIWQLGVPNATSLLGLSFYVQAAGFDPSANAVGLIASDSVRGIVGGR